ncbi:MAG: RagB/SusD family nutrient uptake outer membrane protein, partial [Bacteroidetes bacterium]|nr:RagB/SusD family nutrient uptake outer membrane protein [Bacteroidota bacterium]
MKARYIKILAMCLIFGGMASSCQKNWLDVKPSSDLVVLSTLSDYQNLMNSGELFTTNYLNEVGSDNYYLSDSYLNSTDAITLAYYLWAPNGYNSQDDGNWSGGYQAIFEANSALNGLSKIQTNPGNLQQWNQVEGTALFWRAFHYFDLSQ